MNIETNQNTDTGVTGQNCSCDNAETAANAAEFHCNICQLHEADCRCRNRIPDRSRWCEDCCKHDRDCQCRPCRDDCGYIIMECRCRELMQERVAIRAALMKVDVIFLDHFDMSGDNDDADDDTSIRARAEYNLPPVEELFNGDNSYLIAFMIRDKSEFDNANLTRLMQLQTESDFRNKVVVRNHTGVPVDQLVTVDIKRMLSRHNINIYNTTESRRFVDRHTLM